jgi:hypothetical protein
MTPYLVRLASAIAGRDVSLDEVKAKRAALSDFADDCPHAASGLCSGRGHELFACAECMDIGRPAPKDESLISAILSSVRLARRAYGDF